MNTGIDGGMNKVFASKLPNGSTGLSEGGDGQGLSLVVDRAPGTIPPTVNPPHGPVTSPDEPLVASMAPAPAQAPATRVASAAPNAQSDGFFSNLARKVGLGGATADTTATANAQPVAAKPKVIEARRNEPPHPAASASKATTPKSAVETRQAAARPQLKPSVTDTQTSETAAAPATPAQVTGSQPIVQANSFESRFSATK
jgi:hypothetical protein